MRMSFNLLLPLMSSKNSYYRWATNIIENAMKYRRIIMLAGARQSGKTTLASNLPVDDVIYKNLDDTSQLEACMHDPGGFIKHGNQLMVIDEIQRVPNLLAEIKANVDKNNAYGRFLLTGSSNIYSMPTVTESLAGRVTKVKLRTLSYGEILGTKNPKFLKNALVGKFVTPKEVPTRKDYLSMAFRGMYPEVVKLPRSKSRSWYRDYLEALLEKDLGDIIKIRKLSEMKKLIEVTSAWSTKSIDLQKICSDMSLGRKTLGTYLDALETMNLLDKVGAWPDSDYKAARRKEKLVLNDSGIISGVLRWNLDKVLLDSDMSGKLIETFVYTQLACLVGLDDEYKIYHYRDSEKREIDFIIKDQNNNVLGIEVKSGTSVEKKSFKHLEWFHKNIATNCNFIGILLYTGQNVLSFGKNLKALPISVLWY